MIDETRGSLRVRSWPKPRGPNRHPTNTYWTRWLQWATYTYRYAPAKFKAELEAATLGTPYMPRDIWIASMRGTAFLLQDEHGRTYYPMTARQDISESLDVLAQLPGDMLFRSSGLWVPIHGGSAGQVLTYADDSTPPTWETPASAAIVCIPIVQGQDADITYNVNTTSYSANDRRSIPIPIDDFPFTHYKLQIDGHSTQAGQTIDVIMAPRSDPTTPLGGSDPNLQLTNTNAVVSTDWIERTESLSGFARISLCWKGSNSTVDVVVQQITLWLKVA